MTNNFDQIISATRNDRINRHKSDLINAYLSVEKLIELEENQDNLLSLVRILQEIELYVGLKNIKAKKEEYDNYALSRLGKLGIN
jgi:hypothetical protein